MVKVNQSIESGSSGDWHCSRWIALMECANKSPVTIMRIGHHHHHYSDWRWSAQKKWEKQVYRFHSYHPLHFDVWSYYAIKLLNRFAPNFCSCPFHGIGWWCLVKYWSVRWFYVIFSVFFFYFDFKYLDSK